MEPTDDTFHHIADKASEIADMFQDPLSSWWPWIIASIVGFVVCIKSYFSGIDCPSKAHIEGKVVVITGANCGIGLEIAKELARRGNPCAVCVFHCTIKHLPGARLVLACRDVGAGEEAVQIIQHEVRDADVSVLPLNLCSFASVRKFVAALDFPAVDVLINNAGVVFHPEGLTEDGHEFHLQTNYLGPFLLTHLLLPRLQVRGGRIINVSAVAHFAGDICLENLNMKGCFSAREAFSQSKLASILMTQELASRLQGTKVTINALHPGMVRGTQHMRHSPFSSSIVLKAPMLPWLWLLTKNPQQGAQTAVFLAVEPALSKVSGKYYVDCGEKQPSDKVKNKDLSMSLYEKTCNLVGVPEIKNPR